MDDRYIVEKEFDHDGYKCVVIFGAYGYRCGYVGVPKSHPLYGKKYSDYLEINKRDIKDREVSGIFPLLCMLLDSDERVRIEAFFQVHGGITYSDGGKNSEYPIESDLWWFGFDCGHCYDGKELELACDRFPKYRIPLLIQIDIEREYPVNGEVVRTEQYVADECRKLAEQLKIFEKSEESVNE
mgnify:CR=1 FL=1